MARREGSAQVIGGFAIVAWGLMAALFISFFAWGGVWEADLPERLLWFSPALIAFAIGITMIVTGTLKLVRGRAA